MVLPLSEPIHMRDGTNVNAAPIPEDTGVVPDIGASNTDPGPQRTMSGALNASSSHFEPLPPAMEDAHVLACVHTCAPTSSFLCNRPHWRLRDPQHDIHWRKQGVHVSLIPGY